MMRTMADEYWYRVRQVALAQVRAQTEPPSIPVYEHLTEHAADLAKAA